MKRVSLIAALCLLLLPIAGLANVINFTGSAGGTISLVPGAGGFTTSGITMGYVQGVTVPLHQTGAPGLAVTGGTLSFTGTETGVSNIAGVETYSISLTSLSIAGAVPGAGIASTTLLNFAPGAATALILTTSRVVGALICPGFPSRLALL